MYYTVNEGGVKPVKQAILGLGLVEIIYKDENTNKYFAMTSTSLAKSQLGGVEFDSIDDLKNAYKKQGLSPAIVDYTPLDMVAGTE